MKLIDRQFVKNYDKNGDMTFTQVKMVETPTLNCYIYRRDKMDGTFFSYEVFYSKRRHKGDKLPGGLVESEDREVYPTCNSFGFNAKETNDIHRAEQFLSEFVKKLNDKELGKTKSEFTDSGDFVKALKSKLQVTPKVKGQRGRKRIERPQMQYPTIQQFGMKDILKMNEKYNQPLAYQQLQKDIKGGVVIEVGRVKSSSGRGKPSVVYGIVKK